MDLVRYELLPPILIRDLHREARRQALARQAASRRGRPRLVPAAWFGAALIRTGCRLQSAGQRLAAVSAFAAPAPCGCGA